MSQLKDSEPFNKAFLDFLAVVEADGNAIYRYKGKNAVYTRKAVEGHTQQLIDEILNELPEKKVNHLMPSTPESRLASDLRDRECEAFNELLDEVTAILEKKKGG